MNDTTSTHDIKDDSPSVLVLDSKHPGLQDQNYVQRRSMFFNVSRDYRLNNKGLPKVEYTEEENRIWSLIMSKLNAVHSKKACKVYLEGKRLLHFNEQHMPQLHELDQILKRQHNIGLAPAEGLLDTRTFNRYLSNRVMPCTQFLRHGSNPEYTPEPDAVHDVIGHVPPLMNKDYVKLIELFGKGVLQASDEQLDAWARMYWFTIEFGLIEEDGELKAFGAGLLSSYGEMEYCFSNKVKHKLFNIKEVMDTPYDTTCMQDVLFVIPSMEFLYNEIQCLIDQQCKS